MIKLLRLLQGYVLFVAEGGFSERFLNLCKINGINLWNVRNDGVKVEACTSEKDFQRINIAAERSGMTIKTERIRGLKIFAKRHKLRFGAVVGFVLAAGFIVFASGSVWNVEIEQKEGVNVEAFTQTLEDLGVKTGARKKEIDILAVQDELLRRHPELNWVSLNIFGGKAELEYTLTKEKTPSEQSYTPCNIVAQKNGHITLVECYAGTPAVKEGQNVVEGSVLISGVVKNADGTESLVESMGRVFARTDTLVKHNAYLVSECQLTVDVQPCYGIYAFGLQIPFGDNAGCEIPTVTSLTLMGNNTGLPVGLVRYDGVMLEEATVRKTNELAVLASLLNVVKNKRLNYGDVMIEKLVVTQAETDSACTVTARLTCVEDIAVPKIISVEKN